MMERDILLLMNTLCIQFEGASSFLHSTPNVRTRQYRGYKTPNIYHIRWILKKKRKEGINAVGIIAYNFHLLHQSFFFPVRTFENAHKNNTGNQNGRNINTI
jgi:hypothetical protein